MSEFVGRTGSLRVYSYPETRGGSALSVFARNFATGPKGPQAADSQIQWNSIDVGPDPDEDVLITARSTGIMVISGAVGVSNSTGAPILATVTIQVDDVPMPPSSFQVTVPAGDTESIPFLVETNPSLTPVGVPTPIQVLVSGDGLTIDSDSSSISVQEVSVATG